MQPCKNATNRTHDYLYDPDYIVSGKKDLQRLVAKGVIASSQMEYAPVFENMFSELPHHNSHAIVLKNTVNVSSDKLWKEKQKKLHRKPILPDIHGTGRAAFFKMPIITVAPNVIMEQHEKTKNFSEIIEECRQRGTQTKYRESSAQTSPWKAHYKIMDGDPEVLRINLLEENLPPGMQEIEIIKQARKKRIWEKILPDADTPASLKKRRQILEAIEIDQWAVREQEIRKIQQLRVDLVEDMLQKILYETANRTERKLKRRAARLLEERDKKIKDLKHRNERELRRLYRENFGVNTRYHTVPIIEEHVDFKSELYGPLMRFGEHPKRGHAKIHQEYEPQLHNIETLATLPKWLNGNTRFVDPNSIVLPGRRLCIRETRWTENVLKQLYEELLNLRKNTTIKCTLRKRKAQQVILDETVCVGKVSEQLINEYNAALILQNIIRGRATQSLIFEGRDRCRELIQELQSTHALVNFQSNASLQKRMEVLNQQRESEIQNITDSSIDEVFNQIKGSVAGSMLDFLSKELVRVIDERKAHALALLYERERRDKEAAEAGRRQMEERRRKEHDEMFKQVVKMHQDTVDLYLQDIIAEGVNFVAGEEATGYVHRMTEKIREEEKNEPTEFLDKEELISDMICHFVIPEVEKTRMRGRISDKQKKFLRCAHAAIFDKLDNLPNQPENICHSDYVVNQNAASTYFDSPKNKQEDAISYAGSDIYSDSFHLDDVTNLANNEDVNLKVNLEQPLEEDAEMVIEKIVEEAIKNLEVKEVKFDEQMKEIEKSSYRGSTTSLNKVTTLESSSYSSFTTLLQDMGMKDKDEFDNVNVNDNNGEE